MIFRSKIEAKLTDKKDELKEVRDKLQIQGRLLDK